MEIELARLVEQQHHSIKRMAERKIVQIAVSAGSNADGSSDIIYALAADGSLWEFINTGRQTWRKLPALPGEI